MLRTHVIQTCSSIPSLSPKIGSLAFDSGKQNTLIFLDGTIPMWFQSTQYNIPVKIWFTEMYPHHPPIAYVTPTHNMQIKPKHKHVDSAGRCYLPYLSNWNMKTHNVYELCNQLSTMFSSDPPVYQKPAQQAAVPQPQPQPQQQPPPQQYNMNNSMYQPQPVSGYNMPYNAQPQPQPIAQPVESQKQILLRAANEKVQAKVNAAVVEIDQKIKEYTDTEATLKDRAAQLQRFEQQFVQQRASAEQHLRNIEGQTTLVQKYLADNQGKEVDIDTVITPGDVHSAQMLEASAEIDVFEDLMEMFDKLLQKKKISVELYQKNIRELAKEQFMRRALHKKIAAMQGK